MTPPPPEVGAVRLVEPAERVAVPLAELGFRDQGCEGLMPQRASDTGTGPPGREIVSLGVPLTGLRLLS